MKNQTLQYYMHDGPSAFRFELAGDLSNEGAREIDQAWRTASSLIGDRALVVDMTFLTGAGPDGRSLLARWHAGGAQLVAKSKGSRELARAIVGNPLQDFPPPADSGKRLTWVPFHAAFGVPKLLLMLLLTALLLPVQAHSAELKAETAAAWEGYVNTAIGAMQDRTRPGASFLWAFENPQRVAKVHNGEIVVAPAPGPAPRKVPGGLIHHWVAAAFIPNVRLKDLLEVTEDYDRYQEFYRPSVIASKTLARELSDDSFSMLLRNKAFFLTTTLDADYRASNVRLDDRRFYSVSQSTRVQEIENYGEASEHRMPEGQGGGYIWKLCSIARFEERNDGVYVEIEAIALSREIPRVLRFVVDPIVRTVSRNALFTSLQQTEEAVSGRSADVARSGEATVRSIRPQGAAAKLPDKGSAFTSGH